LMIFTLENSKKKDPNILSRPGIRRLGLLFRLAHLTKTAFSVRNKSPATSTLSKKTIWRRKRRKFLIYPKIPLPLQKIVWSSLWDYHWIQEVYYFFT